MFVVPVHPEVPDALHEREAYRSPFCLSAPGPAALAHNCGVELQSVALDEAEAKFARVVMGTLLASLAVDTVVTGSVTDPLGSLPNMLHGLPMSTGPRYSATAVLVRLWVVFPIAQPKKFLTRAVTLTRSSEALLAVAGVTLTCLSGSALDGSWVKPLRLATSRACVVA